STIMDHRTLMYERRKTMEARRLTRGMRTIHGSERIVVPENSWTYHFSNMVKRHEDDQKLADPAFLAEVSSKERLEYILKNDDDKEAFYDPSFKRHQVPLYIRCIERFHESKKKFSNQFRREMNLLIDNQPNADCAWQFVRTVAYTTLWPPLHSRQELWYFERDFLQLTPKEKSRLHKIMNTEFN
ncbi:hypothetical protein KR067_006941, partial [Drosophila pandora]